MPSDEDPPPKTRAFSERAPSEPVPSESAPAIIRVPDSIPSESTAVPRTAATFERVPVGTRIHDHVEPVPLLRDAVSSAPPIYKVIDSTPPESGNIPNHPRSALPKVYEEDPQAERGSTMRSSFALRLEALRPPTPLSPSPPQKPRKKRPRPTPKPPPPLLHPRSFLLGALLATTLLTTIYFLALR